MTAVFGRLQGETLTLHDGLNIIEAPNESGKSTWTAFLAAMLYGINSRERDRAGFIADKNRYAPWSGAAMSGQINCRTDGRELTISRDTLRAAAPMGSFSAVFTGTGNAVPGLTGLNCGETLLGVSREVFVRSAFIRQAGLAISQDPGLERRIASLLTSGEEEVSYTEAADALKKQLNRRRHNRTGQLPALEGRLARITDQAETVQQLSKQLQALRQEEAALSRKADRLSEELALHERWAGLQQQQELAAARAQAAQARQNAEDLYHRLEDANVPENEAIGRLRGAIVNLNTVRRSLVQARSLRDQTQQQLLEAELAVSKSPFAGMTAAEALDEAAQEPPVRRLCPTAGILAALAVLPVLGIGAGSLLSAPARLPLPLLWGLAVLLAAAAAAMQYADNRRRQSLWQDSRKKRFGTDDPQTISVLAQQYTHLLAARDAASDEARRRADGADTLYNSLTSNEQAILLEIRRFAPEAFDLTAADALLRRCATERKALNEAISAARETAIRAELLSRQVSAGTEDSSQPARPSTDRETVLLEHQQVLARLTALRSQADQIQGQLLAAGDPNTLNTDAEALRQQIAVLEQECTALRMAMDALDSANLTMQNRFSPALGRRAAEIFSRLTGGRYTGVSLDRDFHLSAEPAGDILSRDAGFLSAGTVDQLYLAVRLAICDLVLPADKHVPLILDDALTNFDDVRCASALRYLQEIAEQRQVILFTCHGREANVLAADNTVHIQTLP